MEIRFAQATDKSEVVAALCKSAAPEMYDFSYAVGGRTPEQYLAYEFRSGRGFCGYPNITAAVIEGAVVGVATFYDGQQYTKRLIATLTNWVAFYGLLRAAQILRSSMAISSLVKTPKKDELYLSGFAVAPTHRSQGIGTAIFNRWLAQAQAKGYRAIYLDVAENNPRAERLYTRLGFNLVKVKQYMGKNRSVKIPNNKEMVLTLRPNT